MLKRDQLPVCILYITEILASRTSARNGLSLKFNGWNVPVPEL
jgi:hypothetical protein